MGGIALFVDGTYRLSYTVNPWKGSMLAEVALSISDYIADCPGVKLGSNATLRVFVEVPENGTHNSRGGVHFAAGMYAQALRGCLDFGRDSKVAVKPSEWRKAVYGLRRVKGISTERWKDMALEAMRNEDVEVRSSDEAEAVLIASYGSQCMFS